MTNSKYSNFSGRAKGSLKIGMSSNFTLIPLDRTNIEEKSSFEFKQGDSLIFGSKSK